MVQINNRPNTVKPLATAIVRAPAANFAAGLTTADLGLPDYQRALRQHEAYCEALEQSGLRLHRLAPDEQYPDATFVEDTAVLTKHCAILTRPGPESRSGEVQNIKPVLAEFYPELHVIREPGTVDGGDLCEADKHFFIGISERTNQAGANQLTELLTTFGYTTSCIDIRGLPDILHLKSGLAYLGGNRLVVIDLFRNHTEVLGYDLIRVPSGEEYAANCVRVNERVLVAAGYPALDGALRELGLETITLEMSEFRKMDGGLSCLSLRF
jgi:dimethylargininase